MTKQSSTVALIGGINQAASASLMQPGELVQTNNFLCDPDGGYLRVGGCDVFDGRTEPWTASTEAAETALRAVIQAVPGAGPVLGLAVFNGCVLAARNAVGNATSALYRSSAGGWVLVKSGMPAGGVYRFAAGNIEGFAGQRRLFVVSGTRKGFAVNQDWTTADITTGMTTDAPSFVEVYKDHLFFGFVGGSVQHSAIGNPFSWTIASGAAELSVPDEITGLTSHRGALLIRTKSGIHTLQGTGVANWTMALLSSVLSRPDTAVAVGDDLLHITRAGAQSIQATAAYGDFVGAMLSDRISKLSSVLVDAKAVTVDYSSGLVRWYCGAVTLALTVKGSQPVGWSELRYPFDATCAASNQELGTFVGAANGFVYQLDRGTGFIGKPIDSFIRIAPFNAGDLTRRKRFNRADIEIASSVPLKVAVSPEFDFSAVQGLSSQSRESPAQGARFGTATYDVSRFDAGGDSAVLPVYISGVGRNVALTIGHSGRSQQFRINSVTYFFSPRGQL